MEGLGGSLKERKADPSGCQWVGLPGGSPNPRKAAVRCLFRPFYGQSKAAPVFSEPKKALRKAYGKASETKNRLLEGLGGSFKKRKADPSGCQWRGLPGDSSIQKKVAVGRSFSSFYGQNKAAPGVFWQKVSRKAYGKAAETRNWLLEGLGDSFKGHKADPYGCQWRGLPEDSSN